MQPARAASPPFAHLRAGGGCCTIRVTIFSRRQAWSGGRNARSVFACDARGDARARLGSAGFRRRVRGCVCGPSLLWTRHHRARAGGCRLPRVHAQPAGLPQCAGLCALWPAQVRLHGRRRQHRLHGQPLYRGQAPALPGPVLPGRQAGPAAGPRDDRLLQPHPRGLRQDPDHHRRRGGLAPALCALRLLGRQRPPFDPGRLRRGPALLRHGGKADRSHRGPPARRAAADGHPRHLLHGGRGARGRAGDPLLHGVQGGQGRLLQGLPRAVRGAGPHPRPHARPVAREKGARG